VGLKTGLANYDDKMGGLLPGEYTIIAGPTTIGKTTFARQWCRNITASHYALWVALEMTPENLMDKDVSALSGVPVRDIVRGRYGEETYAKMGAQFEILRKLKLYTVSGRVTTKDIRNYIRRMLATTGLSVVFIDYIQLLSDKYGENNNARIGFITKELENTCKEFRVPIVGLSQLSRAPDKRPNKRPITGDLRDSGDLEHSADTIVFLYSSGYYDSKKEKSRQISECIIAKNRLRGFTGRLWLRWNPKYETNEPVRRTGKDDYADYRPEFEGIGEGYEPGTAESDE
jgi:replicative DNA helicase